MAKSFDWKITAKKAGLGVAYVLVSGLIVILTDEPVYGAIAIPVLMAAQNVLKHKFGLLSW